MYLVSAITNYFSPSNNEPSVCKPNDTWNHPINGDVDRNFRVYFQNPHGIPRDVSLDQDLMPWWWNMMSDATGLWRLI
jgi:hypothetical protein